MQNFRRKNNEPKRFKDNFGMYLYYGIFAVQSSLKL